MKKVIGAVLAGLLALCGLFSAGCAKREETAVRYLRIGVVEYNANDTFISELVSCLKADFRDLSREDLNISVTVKDAAGSQRTENSCVEELIDGGCEVLCVNLVDRATTSSIIDQAMEHDVPIVFFNREPVREDLMQWEKLYYVGSDPTQSGQMQGELASDRILSDPPVDRDGDGKIQFVLLEGEPGHQDAIIRTESSVSTIRDRGIALEKLSYSIANWNRAQAMTRMSQLITQYGNSIELVLANNDDMALGAIDTGRTSPRRTARRCLARMGRRRALPPLRTAPWRGRSTTTRRDRPLPWQSLRLRWQKTGTSPGLTSPMADTCTCPTRRSQRRMPQPSGQNSRERTEAKEQRSTDTAIAGRGKERPQKRKEEKNDIRSGREPV